MNPTTPSTDNKVDNQQEDKKDSLRESLDRMYDKGIDHSIQIVKLVYASKEDEWLIHEAIILKIISQLEQLKSK